MPKVQITKDMILDAALKLLIAQGHEAVNIKSVAKALGCSTQPISWTFGNMENFRTALAQYALEYANRRMHSESSDPVEEYERIGAVYVDLAFEAPNLIRFLRSDEKRLQGSGGLGGSFDPVASAERRAALARRYGCTEEAAGKFMLNTLIYTQGLVSMIIAGGLPMNREAAHSLLREAGDGMLQSVNIQKN